MFFSGQVVPGFCPVNFVTLTRTSDRWLVCSSFVDFSQYHLNCMTVWLYDAVYDVWLRMTPYDVEWMNCGIVELNRGVWRLEFGVHVERGQCIYWKTFIHTQSLFLCGVCSVCVGVCVCVCVCVVKAFELNCGTGGRCKVKWYVMWYVLNLNLSLPFFPQQQVKCHNRNSRLNIMQVAMLGFGITWARATWAWHGPDMGRSCNRTCSYGSKMLKMSFQC